MELPVIAVYDANILYRAPLRDLLIRLAQAGLVRARWTETIHDEWIRNVLKENPQLSAERLARTRALMNEAVRDCLVTDYEHLIASLSLPDPDDRHVLAAAIKIAAGVIVTYKLADFPAESLARFDIEAQHPDDFLVGLFDLAPGDVCAAIKRQRESLRNPPRSAEELLATLESLALTTSVARLRQFIDLLEIAFGRPGHRRGVQRCVAAADGRFACREVPRKANQANLAEARNCLGLTPPTRSGGRTPRPDRQFRHASATFLGRFAPLRIARPGSSIW
jgi:predicted nucleic acid-binding protein